MRTLALPKEVEHWSLTTLREKLVKIGWIRLLFSIPFNARDIAGSSSIRETPFAGRA
jgi:hypothetical protein